MGKKKTRQITEEEAKAIIEEINNGPAITSKTSITHHRTTKFSMSKEPTK